MDSLTKRRDNRSVEVFGDNIKDYTEREHIYAEAFKLDLIDKLNRDDIVYENRGVDNTGNPILGKLSVNPHDYSFFIGSKELKVEICTAPLGLYKFLTFKVHKLERVVAKVENLLITKPDCYFHFKLEAVKWMLDNLEHKIYLKFSPNDIAVRIYTSDRLSLGKLVSEQKWSSKAQEFIDVNNVVLLRTKREN